MPDLSLVTVTPKIAEKWLGQNTDNRPLRAGVVEKYAADMRAGTWTQCIVPIAFYEDGSLADGQHRLWAIVESGTTQKFALMQGIKRTDGANIDRGLIRKVADNLKIADLFDKPVSHGLVASVKAIDTGRSGAGDAYTQAEVLELLKRYYAEAAWAEGHGPKKQGLRNACVIGAVARAYTHEHDHSRLYEFCRILDTGFANGQEDTAAVAIRNYLLERGNAAIRSNEFEDTFKKIQNAISYFMRRKKLTVIKSVAEEAYPLKTSPLTKPHVPVKKSAAIIAKQKNQQRVRKNAVQAEAKKRKRAEAAEGTP